MTNQMLVQTENKGEDNNSSPTCSFFQGLALVTVTAFWETTTILRPRWA